MDTGNIVTQTENLTFKKLFQEKKYKYMWDRDEM